MTKILILGAHGATARIVTDRLLAETDKELVLYLRNSRRLSQYADIPRVTVIDGDVQDVPALVAAMAGVQLVYSNVGGTDLAKSTAAMLTAMKQAGVDRLIFYSALGALREVPGKYGEWNEQAIAAYLPGFREANELILAASTINTTQLRPAWLDDKDEVDYELTGKSEPFKGTEVSRQSVADFVVRLIKEPQLYPDDSLGLDKPNTDGDKPAWM